MSIGSEQFRDALRHFPSGVTIVTMPDPDGGPPHGLTVSAFASVSPKPPLIMIMVDHRAGARGEACDVVAHVRDAGRARLRGDEVVERRHAIRLGRGDFQALCDVVQRPVADPPDV